MSDDVKRSRTDEGDGPCLELEDGPGVKGTLFRLGHDAQIGNTVTAHVYLRVPEMHARHARIFRVEDQWFIQDVQGQGTTVNRKNIGRDAIAIDDGDRIVLQQGAVTLRYRAARPPLSGVEEHAAWVTFAPWSDAPQLAYALGEDDVIRTAAFTPAPEAFTTDAPDGVAVVHRDPKVVIYAQDLAGVRWADLLWRTSEQGAALDGRLLLAAAALMVRGGDVRASRMHATWSGALAWFARPETANVTPRQLPPLGPLEREKARAALVVHLVLIAAGCTRVRGIDPYVERSDAQVLIDHRATLPTLALDADVRAALARLIEVALTAHTEIKHAIERERAALGALAAADLAGLVAHLFPQEQARHVRTVEEAHVLGVDGVRALGR